MYSSNLLRIGISMRVVEAKEYYEPRDALAQDWTKFMKHALPEVTWLPIPNLKDDVVDFYVSWGLNGIILTGGNDLFERPERDRTELLLLEYSLKNNIPVLGVCRGLQLIAHYFGHKIVPCEGSKHAGTRHDIHVENNYLGKVDSSINVNSYHNKCAGYAVDYIDPLVVLAKDNEGLVEAFLHSNKPILSIMWHPEREDKITDIDRRIIRKIFGLEANK